MAHVPRIAVVIRCEGKRLRANKAEVDYMLTTCLSLAVPRSSSPVWTGLDSWQAGLLPGLMTLSSSAIAAFCMQARMPHTHAAMHSALSVHVVTGMFYSQPMCYRVTAPETPKGALGATGVTSGSWVC